MGLTEGAGAVNGKMWLGRVTSSPRGLPLLYPLSTTVETQGFQSALPQKKPTVRGVTGELPLSSHRMLPREAESKHPKPRVCLAI
jgi:hypothetical protein